MEINKAQKQGRDEPYPSKLQKSRSNRQINDRAQRYFVRTGPRNPLERPYKNPEYALQISCADAVQVLKGMNYTVKWPERIKAQ